MVVARVILVTKLKELDILVGSSNAQKSQCSSQPIMSR